MGQFKKSLFFLLASFSFRWLFAYTHIFQYIETNKNRNGIKCETEADWYRTLGSMQFLTSLPHFRVESGSLPKRYSRCFFFLLLLLNTFNLFSPFSQFLATKKKGAEERKKYLDLLPLIAVYMYKYSIDRLSFIFGIFNNIANPKQGNVAHGSFCFRTLRRYVFFSSFLSFFFFMAVARLKYGKTPFFPTYTHFAECYAKYRN